MGSVMHFRKRVLLSMLCLLVGQFSKVSYARDYSSMVAEAEDHIVGSQSAQFNEDVTLTLKLGQAIRLNCPANDHLLDHFLVYFYEDDIDGKPEGIIRTDAIFRTGYSSGGGSRVSGKGSLRQAGHSLCLVITEWQVKGEMIEVRWRASNDVLYNRAIYRRWKQEKGRFSTMYKDRRLLPVEEITEAARIAGFCKLWSEVKYNFAFFEQVPDLDWEEVLEEYIPKVQAAETAVAYYDVLRECIALLQDGHTSVWGPDDTSYCRVPIQLEAIENQAVVTQLFPMDQVKDPVLVQEWEEAGIQLGDVITRVDSQLVPQVLTESLYPMIAASTPQARDRKAYSQLLCGPNGSRAILDVAGRDGTRKQVSLTRGPYSFSRPGRSFVCKSLAQGILYVNLSSFGSKRIVAQFDDVFDQVQAAQGLILDVRYNGGGSTSNGYAILGRLVEREYPGARFKTRRHTAAFKAWGREPEWYEGNHSKIKPHKTLYYGGPVVVLTGPDTFSAAEDFVAVFQHCKRGKVIGRRTGGSTGQPLQIKLPGGGGARICTKWDTYPDGKEFVGIGCIPDLEIAPSRADIAEGRDAVLEKALEILAAQSGG